MTPDTTPAVPAGPETGPPLSTIDVARMLRVSDQTVLKWVHSDDDPLPHTRLSKRLIRYDRAAVLAWWVRRSVGLAPPAPGG